MTKEELKSSLESFFVSKYGLPKNQHLPLNFDLMLSSVIAKAISEHEAVELKIRLQQFSDFVEHRYPMNASGIPFSKAVELYLERINPTLYKDKQDGGER